LLQTQSLKVRITLTEPLLGTVPKDQAVYSTYIASKAPAPESGEEETSTVPVDLEARGWTGFHQDENGIFIYDYLIKGFLKEAGNVLKDALKIKALKSKIENFVFVNPRRIYLGKEPAGYIERPLRVQTPQGERSALARSDYVSAGTSFEIEIQLLPHKELTVDVILQILEYGQLKGLGQNRNSGYGRFKFELSQ